MTSINPKRIAVLVPSYNHERFVERCLRSIFAQTRPPDELLVIDDGSSDASVGVIERVLADCPFPTKFIARENRGLCATLNEGLDKTAGDYFAYLGSDDIWFPRFLEERHRMLEADLLAVLACGHGELIDENDNAYDNSRRWNHFGNIGRDARPLLYFGSAPVNPTVFYRREPLSEIHWNENAKLEDYELYLRLAERGKFAFDDQILSAWRKHGHNTSSDVDFMLAECLAAQARAAAILGWKDSRLKDVQARTIFFHLRGFEESGYRRREMQIFLSKFRGSRTFKSLIHSLLHSIKPSFILENRKLRKFSRSQKQN